MDYESVKRLRQLVTTLTDAKQTALDADKLADLKALLKPNEELVACTLPLLLDRLAANHAQVFLGLSKPHQNSLYWPATWGWRSITWELLPTQLQYFAS